MLASTHLDRIRRSLLSRRSAPFKDMVMYRVADGGFGEVVASLGDPGIVYKICGELSSYDAQLEAYMSKLFSEHGIGPHMYDAYTVDPRDLPKMDDGSPGCGEGEVVLVLVIERMACTADDIQSCGTQFNVQVAGVLRKVADLGVLLIDIKPGNIMICDSVPVRAKLIDFGADWTRVDDIPTDKDVLFVAMLVICSVCCERKMFCITDHCNSDEVIAGAIRFVSRDDDCLSVMRSYNEHYKRFRGCAKRREVWLRKYVGIVDK